MPRGIPNNPRPAMSQDTAGTAPAKPKRQAKAKRKPIPWRALYVKNLKAYNKLVKQQGNGNVPTASSGTITIPVSTFNKMLEASLT